MPKRVLLADDDANIQVFLRDYLEAFGFEVLAAENGVIALERVERDAPDLLILDMAMPLLDGWGVAARVRHAPKTAGLPIIALTAHIHPESRFRAYDAGCDAFLAKPFDPADVLSAVQRLLRLA
jgi:CheY-like chemotaxis protein